MKKVLIIIIPITITLVITWGFCKAIGFTWIIGPSVDMTDRVTYSYKKVGDVFYPFKQHIQNIDSGDWCCYIVLNEEYSINNPSMDARIPRVMCLMTTDKKLLETMRDVWDFEYSGTDAGAYNRLYLYHNDTLVFSAGVDVEGGNFNLQSFFGYIRPVDRNKIINVVQQFHEPLFPIVCLP